MSDVVSRLKVLRNKINDKAQHKSLSMRDIDICEAAVKEIESIRFSSARWEEIAEQRLEELMELRKQH